MDVVKTTFVNFQILSNDFANFRQLKLKFPDVCSRCSHSCGGSRCSSEARALRPRAPSEADSSDSFHTVRPFLSPFSNPAPLRGPPRGLASRACAELGEN